MSDNREDILHAVTMLENDSRYCAYWFRLWMHRHVRRLADVARELDTRTETALRIALCYAPRYGKAKGDLLRISKMYKVSIIELARIICLCDPRKPPVPRLPTRKNPYV